MDIEFLLLEVEATTPSTQIGKEPLEDSRASTSSQRSASTFENLPESPEADITSIPVLICGQIQGSSSGDTPVSVQELVYVRKAAAVETSAQLLGILLEVKKKQLAQKKETTSVEAPQASASAEKSRRHQRSTRRERKRQREGEGSSGTNSTHWAVEFQRKKGQPWKMC
ncbi:hypothetical protein O181_026595 [Austropuccinia psidii MF-1]|uniref:Uncharacterized protein n=1 Tax=Austropuccinia psidii MF-1 TaxID=1389203 RepID=A0A9Q3H2C0_9BASI|nr:hypothetical protein [Austropuccinia psidii MF-1]